MNKIFFTAEAAEGTEKERFEILLSALLCFALRLKTRINYAPKLSPNLSFLSLLLRSQLLNTTATLVLFR